MEWVVLNLNNHTLYIKYKVKEKRFVSFVPKSTKP